MEKLMKQLFPHSQSNRGQILSATVYSSLHPHIRVSNHVDAFGNHSLDHGMIASTGSHFMDDVYFQSYQPVIMHTAAALSGLYDYPIFYTD